jgi:hypothetical protein
MSTAQYLNTQHEIGTCHSSVYSVEILLMMDSGHVRNMYGTLWNKLEKEGISLAFIIKIYQDARSSKCKILLVAFRQSAWTRILLFDIKSRPASRPTSFLFERVGALSQALKQARTKHSIASTVEVKNAWNSYLHCIMIYLHHSLQLLKPVSFQILDAVFSSCQSFY